MNIIRCCYGCPDRYAGCHAKCEKYQREKKEYERQKGFEKCQKAREVESIVEKYIKKVRADLQPLKKFAKESAENG